MVSHAEKSHTQSHKPSSGQNHVLSLTLTIGPVLLLNLLETDRNALPLTTFKIVGTLIYWYIIDK